ncbi:MAG: nucleotidyltransferase domain-containing protein [Promethearchaeota archaeon]
MNERKEEIFGKIKNIGLKDPDILAILVFGSYTRKEYYRDIDICLIFYPKVEQKKKFKRFLEISGSFGDLYDISYFSELPLYIKSRVIKEGQIILNKEYNSLFDIYMKTIKDYSLFKPHFDTFLKAVKNG